METAKLSVPNHPLHDQTVEVVRRDPFKRFVVVRVLTAHRDYKVGDELRFDPWVVLAEKPATLPRKKLEALVWKHTHADFKGKREDGTKVVLKLIPEAGTCSVPLSSLTDAELFDKLPSKVKKEMGLS